MRYKTSDTENDKPRKDTIYVEKDIPSKDASIYPTNSITNDEAQIDKLISSVDTNDTEIEYDTVKDINSKRKERKRKKNSKMYNVPNEIKDNRNLRKYFYKRYSLFSRFDEGIKLDEGEIYFFY